MIVARSVLIALLVIAPAIGAEETRPKRDPLYPMSFQLSGAAVAVSADGTPHILYPDPNDLLRHAWLEDGVWRDEPVSPELSSLGPRSIAVDSLGRPHVAYSGSGLVHGVREESGWKLTQIAPTGSSSAGIVLLPDDRPAVYHDRPDGNLEVLVFDGETWPALNTGLTGSCGYETDFAFDAEGNCHLLFERQYKGVYATNASGTWTETSFTPSKALALALALDAAGHPHVIAFAPGPSASGVLLHFWDDGSGWQSEEVIAAGDPFPNRIVRGLHIDGSGHIFVTYTDGLYIRHEARGFPRVAYHDGERWREPYTRRSGDATVHSSALGPRGEIRLACSGAGLLLVSFSLSDLEANWDTLVVTAEGDGLRATGTLRVANHGAGRSAPTRIEYYLSDDDLFDPSDERVGPARRLDFIRPDRERSFPVSLALPASAAGRYLLAVVDPDARRDDIDRPNNTAAVLLVD